MQSLPRKAHSQQPEAAGSAQACKQTFVGASAGCAHRHFAPLSGDCGGHVLHRLGVCPAFAVLQGFNCSLFGPLAGAQVAYTGTLSAFLSAAQCHGM
jgi:hypothetical protein